jgi:hypothetical protein
MGPLLHDPNPPDPACLCGESCQFNCFAEEAALTDALDAAVDRGDWATVHLLAFSAGSRIAIDPSRGVLHLMSCRDLVGATLPVPKEQLLAITGGWSMAVAEVAPNP